MPSVNCPLGVFKESQKTRLPARNMHKSRPNENQPWSLRAVCHFLGVFQQQCLQSTQGHARAFTCPFPQQGLTRSTNLVIGTDSQLPDCTVLVLFANVCLCVCSARLQTPACVHSTERARTLLRGRPCAHNLACDPQQCTRPASCAHGGEKQRVLGSGRSR